MTRTAAWLSALVLGFMVLLPTAVTSTTPAGLCKSINTLKDSLNFTNRRQYMKHNFPINYTIRVHYEEVFRVRNISKLNRTQDLEAQDLQELWLVINQEVLKKVLRVLPERHPSRKYVSDLEHLLRMVEQVFQQVFQQDQDEERQTRERIREICNRVRHSDVTEWKLVKPKALLDNCYRTMHCLFCDCFQCQENFCDVLHWKRGKKRPSKQA
ncbi:hypothetical protein SKAU_G00114480 [Synaphobranchus kaupii]|uniref:Interleukin 34 n=1 Tax=Synaphobranchus kaupii TaxID=118154 RepID=A0A9Q1G109_SYNKA|nr:hypothetical protein SKAU_G00114480 [Synaphobranchus kaupii]